MKPFLTSKIWNKKRVNRLADELEAYMKHYSAPENGGHNIYTYQPSHKGCGICVIMHSTAEVIRELRRHYKEDTLGPLLS